MISTILLQFNQWIPFFGKFHPLLVHLPIGFILIAFLLELGRLFNKIDVKESTVSFILFWSAMTAILSCVAGYMLSLGGGYDENLLDEHKWQGIWVAVISTIAWLFKSEWTTDKIPFADFLYKPLLLVGVILLMVAGHHGGSLTHGEDYISQETPEPFRAMLGIAPKTEKIDSKPITDINKAMVYQDVVQPILKQNCFQCHNATKSKGNLRMDEVALLQKGGKNGAIFVNGKSAESEMIKRCLLPLDDEHHMPPKGKPQISEQQLSLLNWWIDEGASFEKKITELKPTEVVKPILASLTAGAAIGVAVAKTEFLSTLKTIEPDKESVDKLKKLNVLVLPLASDQPNLLEINAVNAGGFNDEQAKLFSKLSEQIVWLKLSDTKITDRAVLEIDKLKNLQKLNLEKTGISDVSLKNLNQLTHLEYLNLVETSITDAGLVNLATCKNLKQLYLWQTKTTPEGIAKLKSLLPNLEIVSGITESQVADFIKLGEKAPKPEAAKK